MQVIMDTKTNAQMLWPWNKIALCRNIPIGKMGAELRKGEDPRTLTYMHEFNERVVARDLDSWTLPRPSHLTNLFTRTCSN